MSRARLNADHYAGSTSASALDAGTLAVARMAAGTVIKTTTFMQNFTSDYYFTLNTGSETVITFNSVAMQITGLSATEGNKLLIWASAGDQKHTSDGSYQTKLGFIIDSTFYSSHGTWGGASALIAWPTTSLMVFTVPASFTGETISYAGFKETGTQGTHSMMARGGQSGGYTTSIIIQEIAV